MIKVIYKCSNKHAVEDITRLHNIYGLLCQQRDTDVYMVVDKGAL